MDNFKNKSITIRKLINFAKKYDKNGDNRWMENKYEGASFIFNLLIGIGIKNMDGYNFMKKNFPYLEDEDYGERM